MWRRNRVGRFLTTVQVCTRYQLVSYSEDWTTGPEAHLVIADRAVSGLGFNRYPGSYYTEFDQTLDVERIGLLVHLLPIVLHIRSTDDLRYSFITGV